MPETKEKVGDYAHGFRYLNHAQHLLKYVAQNPQKNVHQITNAMRELPFYDMPRMGRRDLQRTQEQTTESVLFSLEREGLIKKTEVPDKPSVFAISDNFAESFCALVRKCEEGYKEFVLLHAKRK